jgi:peptide/nickel transport system substrate-binding protein
VGNKGGIGVRRSLGVLAAAVIGLTGTLPLPAIAASCIRVAVLDDRGENQTPDPAKVVTHDDIAFSAAIFEPLVTLNNDRKVVGILAESWSSDAEGRNWTIQLRKNVKWSNGKDFTSKDVVYTYRRLIDPATQSGGAADLSFLTKEGIQEDGPNAVKFTVANPIGDLPTLLATRFARMVPAGASDGDIRFHPVGTGPFKTDSFTPGVPRHTFVKNSNYWRSGLPKADCIEISSITDALARVSAVAAGEVDLDINTDSVALMTMRDNPAVKIKTQTGSTFLALTMWVDAKPFDSVLVRKAMKMVVDRLKIVQTSLSGFGEPANNNPIPPSSSAAFRHDVAKQDIEGAKALLAKAGFPNGLSVDLYTADVYPGITSAVQAYASMAAKAGIKVNIIKTPADGYWDNIWLKKPFISTNWASRSVSSALSVAYRSTAKWPETHWQRPDYDKLLDEGDTSLDEKKRTGYYQKAQQLLNDQGGVIGLGFTSISATMRANCVGFTPNIDYNRPDFSGFFCK